MHSKRYVSTEVDSKTLLHVPSWTLWSTSNDAHQVVTQAFVAGNFHIREAQHFTKEKHVIY